MITSKSDFYGKYLIIPNDIHNNELIFCLFKEIKFKFETLGFDTERLKEGKFKYMLTGLKETNLNEPLLICQYFDEDSRTFGDTLDIYNIGSDFHLEGISIKDFLERKADKIISSETCPHCGYNEKEIMDELVEQAKINGERMDKYGIEFDTPFAALNWCYLYPETTIEVYSTHFKQTYLIKYNKDLERIVWFGDYKRACGTVERRWRVLREIEYIYDWTNIKKVKEENERKVCKI